MANLSRDQILEAQDLQRKPVSVPEWGGEVYVRELTGEERDEYEAATVVFEGGQVKSVNLRNARALLVIMTACDENGAPLFERGDLEALQKKSKRAIDRLYEAAAALNDMTVAELEDAEKNSGGGLSANGGFI